MSGSLTTPVAPVAAPPTGGAVDPNLISGVMNAISGGNNPNAVAAGNNGANNATNDFYGSLGKAIQDANNQMTAAFQAGKVSGGNAATISQQVQTLATQKANALLQSGQAAAGVAYNDAQQKAAADKALADEMVRMHLSPNDPVQVKFDQDTGDANKAATDQIQKLLDMRKTGFFDNPAEYLYNHIVGIPIAEGRAQDALEASKMLAEQSTANSAIFNLRNAVDTTINSVNTTTRAADLYKQALGAATAAGIDPLIQAKQLEIGAYDMQANQSRAASAAARVEMERQLLPGQLAAQQQEAQLRAAEITTLPAQKAASIDMLRATADFKAQEAVTGKLRVAEQQDATNKINTLISSFGGQGNLAGLSGLSKQTLGPTLVMSQNFSNFGSLGKDPADSFMLLKQSGMNLSNLPPGHLATVQNLNNLYNEAVTHFTNIPPGQERPPASQLPALVQDYMNSRINQETLNVSGNNHFWALPTVNGLFANNLATGNPVLEALQPTIKDGSGNEVRRNLDGNLLINTAAQMVVDKRLTLSQAAAAMRDAGSKLIGATQYAMGAKRFGFQMPTNYILQYRKEGLGMGTAARQGSVNLMNSADITKQLIQQITGIQGKASMLTMPGITGDVP